MNLQKFVIYVKEELIKYLQNEKYKGLIIRKKNSSDDNNLQNDLIKIKQIDICQHPKHEIYLNEARLKNKKIKENKNLIKIPERLIKILELDEFTKICSMCRKRTDKDLEYLQNEEYKAPISRKIDDNILKIENHTYSLRNDILYTIKDLKQLESDYQEIIAQLTILNEISLNNKIRKMSNILYNNQHKLNQKPIYNPIVFKIILEIADKDLIRFFNELYIRINPDTKSNKTNKSNKKKLVSLYYFLASINNKYINSIKANIGSYLQTSGASSSSIDTLANIGISVTRKIVNRQKINISNEYEQSVDDYCLKNIEKMFILNIDDYHNIHHHNIPSLLETHNILHFITILLNSNSNISRIPYCSNNILLHNPKEIDSNLIIKNLEDYFMNQIGKNYYEQNELWK